MLISEYKHPTPDYGVFNQDAFFSFTAMTKSRKAISLQHSTSPAGLGPYVIVSWMVPSTSLTGIHLSQDRYKVPYTHCGCPHPGTTVRQRIRRVLTRKEPPDTTLQPPETATPGTHPSDHNAVFAMHNHRSALNARERRQQKSERRRRREAREATEGGKSAPDVQHVCDRDRDRNHPEPFLYPIPLYYVPIAGCVVGVGRVVDGGVGAQCASVRDVLVLSLLGYSFNAVSRPLEVAVGSELLAVAHLHAVVAVAVGVVADVAEVGDVAEAEGVVEVAVADVVADDILIKFSVGQDYCYLGDEIHYWTENS